MNPASNRTQAESAFKAIVNPSRLRAQRRGKSRIVFSCLLAAVVSLGLLVAAPANLSVAGEAKLPTLYPAPEFRGLTNWLNSKPIESMESLRGKVVLIDFWTYSCINCINTLPYVKKWHKKYADKGLVVIGVHAPEFKFERIPKNVVKAVKDYKLQYPIALDNGFKLWRAYRNRYWPAKYLIDKNGVVRFTHFGEGRYKETEAAIVALLKSS